MSKREELNAALKEAMKNKDTEAMATIRLIIAAMKDKDIASRTEGRNEGIDDPAILTLMQSMIKQRQESSKIYKDAGRAELAAKEDSEIKIIERFLPQQMSDAEAKQAIQELMKELNVVTVKDMGKLMAALKARYAGQMDMSKASGLVREQLSV